MKNEFLFVYGTLRRGPHNEMHQLLARHVCFVGDATYQGRLYRVDDYPGVVPSSDPTDAVHGEFYKLLEPGLVLPKLDDYEECGAGFPKPTEYVRQKEIIKLQSGEKIAAWIYIYNRPVKNLQFIGSGDFLNETR